MDGMTINHIVSRPTMAHMKYDEIRIYPNYSSLDLHVPHLPGAHVMLCPVSEKTGPARWAWNGWSGS